MFSDDEVSCLALLGSTSINDRLKRSLLLYCPSSVIKRVVQVVREVVFGQLSIPEEDKQRLRRHRTRIHRLARAERSEDLKRRQLAQKSSLTVLSAILNSALPALSSQLSGGNGSDEPTASS